MRSQQHDWLAQPTLTSIPSGYNAVTFSMSLQCTCDVCQVGTTGPAPSDIHLMAPPLLREQALVFDKVTSKMHEECTFDLLTRAIIVIMLQKVITQELVYVRVNMQH